MTGQPNQQKCSESTLVVSDLISVGLINTDVHNCQGLMPLHVAVKNNKYLLVKSLLQNGADVNAKNKEGEAPLAMAIRLLFPKMVEILLQHQADINKVNRKGKSALWLAMSRHTSQSRLTEQSDIMNLIFQRGLESSNNSETDYYKLCEAIINKDLRSAERLISLLDDKIFGDIETENPLKFAVYLGQLKITELLLNKNISNLDHQAALLLAIKKRNLKIVKLLLRFGMDVNFEVISSDKWRQTPLYRATELKNVELMKLLLDHGAQVNGQSYLRNFHQSVLHLACRLQFFEGIKLLLKSQADVNVRDSQGQTPLHYVCARANLNCIKLLVRHGGQISAIDNRGLTILHFAASNWNLDVVKYVISLALENGISINSRDKDGYTAINGILCDNLVEFLKNGADWNIRAKSGRYPKHGSLNEGEDGDRVDYNCPVFYFLQRLRCLGHVIKNPRIRPSYDKIKPQGFLCQELEKLKIEIIAWNPKTTLYNLLFMSRESLVQYSENANLRKAFSECGNDFEAKYPYFGCFLNLMCRQGSNRKNLINSSKDSLQKVFGKSMPDICCSVILKYLKDTDLKKFIND